MYVLDLAPYFDLLAFTLSVPDGADSVPCQIFLGGNRRLEAALAPSCTTASLLTREGDHFRWFYDQPVTFSTRNGVPRLLVSDLLSRLNVEAHACSDQFYQLLREQGTPSHMTAAGPLGMVETRPLLYDKNRWMCRLVLKPGALTLCDRPISAIHWLTSRQEDCPRWNAGLCQQLQALLDRPHSLTGPQLYRLFQNISPKHLTLDTPELVLTCSPEDETLFTFSHQPRDRVYALPCPEEDHPFPPALKLMTELIALPDGVSMERRLLELGGRTVR